MTPEDRLNILDLAGELLNEAEALNDETSGWRIFLPGANRRLTEAKIRLDLASRLHDLL